MKVLFVLITTFLGFIIGLLYGTAAAELNKGLSDSMDVLGFGFLVGLIALALSLVINRKINSDSRNKVTLFFFVVALIPICWMVYRYLTKPSDDKIQDPQDAKTVTSLLVTQMKPNSVYSKPIGVESHYVQLPASLIL